MPYLGIIEKYRKYLPVGPKTPVVSLLEGGTPLIPAPALGAKVDKRVRLYLKYEGANPTGSFKDRGMTMAISKAREAGAKTVICASTGNTSASAAAYSARAGLRCIVLLPKGAIALGKLAQALMHGARVVAVDGNFDDALDLVKEVVANYPVTLVNSLNPFRLEGQKTGAFEIVEQLGGHAPDFHSVPVGNAGNISAYWMGYKQAKAARLCSRTPVMLGFQAAGAAPIVRNHIVKKPETLATAIRIGNPASWGKAVAARDESGGLIQAVTDGQIIQAYRMLAREEGVFCEPASAASFAGVLKLGQGGYFAKQASRLGKKHLDVVCVLTGHGLKDPDCAVKTGGRVEMVRPNLKVLVSLLKL